MQPARALRLFFLHAITLQQCRRSTRVPDAKYWPNTWLFPKRCCHVWINDVRVWMIKETKQQSYVLCIWKGLRYYFGYIMFPSLLLPQIYLSWKSGPAEVKHWKDMLARPRTNVAQWHALKTWWHRPASSTAPSRLLLPPPPTPVLMHKTDLLPGCETRVQLAICSIKPLNCFLFLRSLFPSDSSHFFFSLFFRQPCLSFLCLATLPMVPLFLTVCTSVCPYALCCCVTIFGFFVHLLVLSCTAAPPTHLRCQSRRITENQPSILI